MTFTQIIEVRSDDEAGLHEHARTWHRGQKDAAPGYQGIRILADRDEPGQFLIVVDFADQSQAEHNNTRPETQEWAVGLSKLIVGEPTYRNTQEVCSSYASG
jgi:quinol monooxygenase YgiN